jgi:hypothetical protein
MRCIRLKENSCQRCEKAGRPCLPARATDRRRETPQRKLPHRRETEWSEPLLMSPPETLNTPMSSGTDPPILASIYTTSPYAEAEKLRRESRPRNQNHTHIEDLAIIESLLQSDGQEHDEDLAMSVDHTVQLIKLYVSRESTPLCCASPFRILTTTVFETR